MTKIYNYSSQTKEFLFACEADESPLELGVFLIPAYATDIEPPKTKKNKACIFVDDQWDIVDDFRNTDYWTEDGSKYTMDSLGKIPEKASLTPPPLTNKELQMQFSVLINEKIENKATDMGYDSFITALTYIHSTNEQYATDAKNLVAWRDSIWEWAIPLMDTINLDNLPEKLISNIPLFD